MKFLLPLSPLLAAAGILLAGNGLQGTLIALRSAHEGFDASLIGLMGTGYYAGFMLSCLFTARLIRAVGHIRVFSGLAAIAASASLTMVLWLDPVAWVGLRFISGFCFAGLFMVIESWLNASVDNAHRAGTLSVYRMVDLAAVTGSQFLLPVFGAYGFAIFAIAAIMTCLSLVPISLMDRTAPKPPDEFRFSIASIWAISPLACLGCITIGMTNSTFRLMGPIYASDIGFDTTGVATFMSAGIIGGAVLQLPLGWLSDRLDRRWVLIIATLGAAAAGFVLSYAAGTSHSMALTGIFMFGAFALPLYSLSAAHANDRAERGTVCHCGGRAELLLLTGRNDRTVCGRTGIVNLRAGLLLHLHQHRASEPCRRDFVENDSASDTGHEGEEAVCDTAQNVSCDVSPGPQGRKQGPAQEQLTVFSTID